MASVKSGRSSAVVDSSRSRASKVKDDIEKSSSRSNQVSGRGDTLPKIGKDDETQDEYDDTYRTPVMFGDPFGNRGDYSKGIFYGGRKKFLRSEKNGTVNALEPPDDFMTMRQRRNKAKMSKTQVQLVSKRLDFKRKDDNDEAAILARAEAKKMQQQSKFKVIVIKQQSTSKYDWTVQRQAGCKFWVHKPTGTISNEMPVCMDDDEDSLCTSDMDSQESFSSPNKGASTSLLEEDSRDDDDGEGEVPPATGSLVYDSYEFDNFLNILDEMQEEEDAKKKATKASQEAKKNKK